MANRPECELMLCNYPDVGTVKALALILGGISEKTVLSLLKREKIKHFRIGKRYRIPKSCVIDFMMSGEYESLIRRARNTHFMKNVETDEQKKQKLLFLCETPQTRKDPMCLLDIKSKKLFSALPETLTGVWGTSDDTS